jgi:hypothetical protein
VDYGNEEGVVRRCTFLASTKLLTSYVCKICASHSKKVQPEKEAASTRLYSNTDTILLFYFYISPTLLQFIRTPTPYQ